ncbi:MAG TPA: tyrosine-type recombinase/integrase [Isosphaeraceae bacterium]|nr:tyrosine-type recombinase/integrase [Isosphaeraceae bacterium]
MRVDVLAADRPRRQTHLTVEQVHRMLAQADAEASLGSWQAGRLQALVWTYAFTGLRAGEALNLRVADVDLIRRVLTVQPRSTWRPKTVGSARRIPLIEPAAEVLDRWTPRTGCEWLFPGIKLRGPWINGGPGVKALDHVRELGRRAGVEHATILGFRKGIATNWKSWGGSQLARQKLLGHSSPRTAEEWYDEEDLDLLRGVVGRICYG